MQDVFSVSFFFGYMERNPVQGISFNLYELLHET